jgi:hypothetical protein
MQSMMMVQSQALAPWSHTDHSFERLRTPQEGQHVHSHAWQPSAEQEMTQQRNKLTGKNNGCDPAARAAAT